MAIPFTFGGQTITAPGILVRSTIGANRVLQLFPQGTIMFMGESDGGVSGSVYQFTDYLTAQRILRSGNLLTAMQQAIDAGGATQFVMCPIGTKVSAHLNVAGASSAAAVFTAGDQGTWTNQITVNIVTGTNSNTFALIITYPDAISGQTVSVGGKGTAFDNLTTFSGMAAVIAANSLLTPNDGISPNIISLSVTTDGTPALLSPTHLASGSQTAPVFSDVEAGVNNLVDVDWEIGHLVQIYDAPSQAYLDANMQSLEGLCKLRRAFHQIQPSGVSPSQTKAQNSAAVVNAGITAAAALNSKRSSVVGQQVKLLNKSTGQRTFQDVAPSLCGLAAALGATGAWGLATPLTYESIPNASDVDYPILDTTGDRDRAVAGGVFGLERLGSGKNVVVRIIQSVTTAPNDGNGNPWDFSEFSVVRVSDGLLANVKAAVESSSPKAIGGGNDLKTMQAVIAEVHDILELALDARWITGYDPSSVQISTVSSDADIVTYSAAPTRPLNHLGVDQTLLPFQAAVTLSPSGS